MLIDREIAGWGMGAEGKFSAVVRFAGETESGVRLVAVNNDILLNTPRLSGLENLMGGYGVLGRTIDEMNMIIPGISDRLIREEGKIVFLGNGLSDAAYWLGSKKRTIVVVDMFDYRVLAEDFMRFERYLVEIGIGAPKLFGLFSSRLKRLVRGIEEGRIFFEQHLLGSTGRLPVSLLESSMVVNLFGPSMATLALQLGMLALEGELWTNFDLEGHAHELGSEFHLRLVKRADWAGNSVVIKRV